MEEKEFNINLFIKSFLDCWYERKKLTFSNLIVFFELAKFTYNQINEYIKDNKDDIDWYKVTKSSLLQNEKLINNFYQSIEVNFKLDDVIINGVFDIKTNSLNESIESNNGHDLFSGVNYYTKDKKHKGIQVYNNGLLTDSIVWVHEISHYRNQPDDHREEVNHLLTEALAFTEELIYIDYLEKQGYNYETYQMKKSELFNFYNTVNSLYPIVKLYILYDNIGDTSKESYKEYYGNDKDYNDVTKNFIKEIIKDQDVIFNLLYYTLAAPLSIYMYEEYKKNNRFIEKIKELNNSINDKTINECLNIIGLTGYNEESLNKISEDFQSYITELEKNKYKVKELTK